MIFYGKCFLASKWTENIITFELVLIFKFLYIYIFKCGSFLRKCRKINTMYEILVILYIRIDTLLSKKYRVDKNTFLMKCIDTCLTLLSEVIRSMNSLITYYLTQQILKVIKLYVFNTCTFFVITLVFCHQSLTHLSEKRRYLIQCA